MNSFIQKLPKAELHFHFEGSIPWDTVKLLHPSGKNFPETPPWTKDKASVMTFDDFLAIFKDFVRPCLHSIENYKIAAKAILNNLCQRNVKYAEWNVSLKVMKDNKIEYSEGFNVLKEAIMDFDHPEKPIVKLIAGINRENSVKEKLDIIDEIITIDAISGIDMHGHEEANDLSECKELFEIAHTMDWKIKVHAGEFGGVENVRTAVNEFDIHHLCHGIRAAEDEKLIELLAEKQTILELCPSSNLQLGVIKSLEAYPLDILLRKGVKVTVNSDDPLIFNTNIVREYQLVHKMGLMPFELASLAMNSIEASLLASEKKRCLQRTIADLSMEFRNK